MLPIAIVPPAANWWNAMIQKFDSVSALPPPFGGCAWKYTVSDDILTKTAIATRSCAIIADALVVTAIWTKTVNVRVHARRVGARSLLEIIAREGALYFAVLFLLNLISVVLDHLTAATFNPIPSFIDALTSILTSRLMLKLRASQCRTEPLMTDQAIASIKFSPQATRFGSEDSTAIGMDTFAFSTISECSPLAERPKISKVDIESVSSGVQAKKENASPSVEVIDSLNIE